MNDAIFSESSESGDDSDYEPLKVRQNQMFQIRNLEMNRLIMEVKMT